MDNSRLDVVLNALVSLVRADPTIINPQHLNGPHVTYRLSSEAVQQIPSIQYYPVDTGIDEGNEVTLVRWEVWADSFSRAWKIEKQLRRILHTELPRTIAGQLVLVTFDTSYDAAVDAVSTTRRIVETTVQITRQRAVA